MLTRPLTLERLAEACKRCGFGAPAERGDGRGFVTRVGASFLSLGEEIEIEVITPIEIAIRSTSVQTVPILDFGKGASNVRKLAHALRGMPTGLGLLG